MSYRVVCVYMPNIGTFRGKRGAWRVYDCYEADCALRFHPVQVLRLNDPAGPSQLLLLNSIESKQRNSWCNPRSILAKWLEAQH